MNKHVWWIGALITFQLSCESPVKKEEIPQEPRTVIEAESRKFSLHEINNDHLEPTKLDLVDTVLVSMLDSILKEQNLLAAQLDSQLIELPLLIEETENRIADNIKQRNDLKFKELTGSWNKIIEGEKKTLYRFKITYQEVKKLRTENRSLIDFMSKIPKDQPEKIAYFIVEATYETDSTTSTTIMLLNPEGELLKEFELR